MLVVMSARPPNTIELPWHLKGLLMALRTPTYTTTRLLYHISSTRYGFLCPEDRAFYESSEDPMGYLIKMAEAYFLNADIKGVGADGEELRVKKRPTSNQLIFTASMRMGHIRSRIAKVLVVKEYPVVRSYRKHQRLFSAMWLALLPFAMTEKTGFFTTLWAVVIAYAVLALEDLAMKLVDPYGEDEGDLPIRDLCVNASATILEAVNSINWGTDSMIRESLVDNDERLDAVVDGSNIYNKYTVASKAPLQRDSKKGDSTEEDDEQDSLLDVDDDGIVEFCGPRDHRTKISLHAHFIRSVPWPTLTAITVWTVAALMISYVTRDHSLNGQIPWWRSIVAISTNVAK